MATPRQERAEVALKSALVYCKDEKVTVRRVMEVADTFLEWLDLNT